jgi:hypothetical protein
MKIVVFSYLYAVFFILAILSDRLPFFTIINNISRLSISSHQTIRSDIIEDSKKGKILLVNSFGIFKQSLKMAAFIMLVLACGFLLLLLSNNFQHLNYRVLLNYMITTDGLLLSMVSFFSYFLLKKLYVKIRL